MSGYACKLAPLVECIDAVFHSALTDVQLTEMEAAVQLVGGPARSSLCRLHLKAQVNDQLPARMQRLFAMHQQLQMVEVQHTGHTELFFDSLPGLQQLPLIGQQQISLSFRQEHWCKDHCEISI